MVGEKYCQPNFAIDHVTGRLLVLRLGTELAAVFTQLQHCKKKNMKQDP